MILPEFLVRNDDDYIHIAGHRIGLQDVVHYYNEGCSAEELCEVFPTLKLAVIHKIIAFYLEHQAEVDAFVAACEAEMERQRTAACAVRMSPSCAAGSPPSRQPGRDDGVALSLG